MAISTRTAQKLNRRKRRVRSVRAYYTVVVGDRSFGAFKTKSEARKWAYANVPSGRYRVTAHWTVPFRAA